MPRDPITEWARISRPYPIPVPTFELETFDSFSRRVLAENLEDERHQRILTNAAAQFFPGMKRPKQWKALLLVKTGANPALFDAPTPRELRHHDGTSCAGCRVGTGDQWMCRDCAGGASVALQPNLDRLVCEKHHLWLGSGTKPSEQDLVSVDFLVAERRYQELRRRGVADAATLWELIHIVDPSLADEAEHCRMPAHPFPTAVKLWITLSDHRFQREFFAPNTTYAEGFAYLGRTLSECGLGDRDLTTRVWHYLRPTALAVREWLLHGGEFATHWEHDFYIDPSITLGWKAPIRPLEPFSRYLEASGVTQITSENWREVLTHRSAGHPRSFVRARAEGKLPGICIQGHRVQLYSVVQVGKNSSFRCRYCDRRSVVPGETDITCTHPLRATYFDAAANPGIKVTDLLAASERRLNWKCPKGHSFPRYLHIQMASDIDCTTCDEARFTSAEHSLAARCPEAAKQWHATKNACSPNEVYALNQRDLFWFTCDNGHDYQTTAFRRSKGYGCKECAMSALVPKKATRLLCEVRPDLESQWDPSINDGLAFEHVRFTSTVVYKWECKNRHITEKSPRDRAKMGCRECRGLGQSTGNVANRYPLILSEWDYERNDSSPAERIDTSAKHIWRCARAGHIRSATLHCRRATRGCPECPAEERVAYGLKKGQF